ncbi:uncharacterized protein L969DRAFT_85444 [Mixia osmundae IAM 14324]|uniref:Probable electron transfer flavoprotein subunit alpha n=1 Tax=Mixia osmundae (strain CBS 9802 / IAM 14324 / JCM 22182 / KY 12970) TaxID=764103 RepID=G7DYT1_MIXOS|nr:uncharacterized protein L969DRAFT_85444 [Mixia osmundae IAM 14324]KEI41637.1 hypothetical protein L969DRAFT_85444 [Mixia osmundae IAM 14324]GAA95741.1 hypothetical protein E5Q_02398 [Mixia osmundae IAM 14324]
MATRAGLRCSQTALRLARTPLQSHAIRSRAFSSSKAAEAAKTLLYIEHKEGKLNPGVYNAITAAQKLGGEITGLVAGAEADSLDAVAQAAAKYPLSKIVVMSADTLSHSLAEPLAPLIVALVQKEGYTHVTTAHTAQGKNIFPRVAALLDVAQISDVMQVESEDTFVRPIYAGNAIATVKSSDKIKVFTIRTSSFDPAKESGEGASIEKGESGQVGKAIAEWVSESLTKSERPDLGSAARVVSGGRGVKNKENFDSVIIPLADALGAAVGASRAAVDSGYADNSLQVGQTGKVVAPELYVAVGISGAIQHLAGIRDAKCITAINKDPEAPIFEVADFGLVADLFNAAPELTKAVGKK